MLTADARRALRAYLRAVIFAEPIQLELLRRHGITLADLRSLRILRDLGRVPISCFADALGISRSTATGLVDRFESRGLVTREADAGDRRVVSIGLTPRGQEALEDWSLYEDSDLGRRIATLSLPEQRAFADLIERLTGEPIVEPTPTAAPVLETKP
ncbi:MAG TPA: MarR family transcriptional regulator [Thermomicrobiales bacterium]|nr:MarR family transcriptional regulator [Thermomicrobiales bacterium]